MRTDRDFAPENREGRRRFMIAGEHTILRAFEREDAERCYRWMNDPNIVRTLKTRYPIAFQNEAEWLERAMRASPVERHFAVERRDDRTHIGNASIHDIDWVSRSGWFGLFIGEPSAWNRGFGSDAIATLVRFAFEEMNLRKLRINVFAGGIIPEQDVAKLKSIGIREIFLPGTPTSAAVAAIRGAVRV